MKRLIFIIAALITLSVSADNLTEEIRKKEFNTKRGVALEGYDAVAYFMQNAPVKGKDEFSYEYKGIKYHFSSEENMKMFMNDPEKFEPMYGGWCAYAMGHSGRKISINPKTFKIMDGKLYVFYNSWGDNTLKKWNKKPLEYKKAADANWQKYIK
ncbi:MAG: YHS domain-containing (seleno)protein [Hyphomicrobiales bacterium]